MVASWCIGVAPHASAGEPPELRIAVAANFKQTLDKLGAAFGVERARLVVSTGASGMLYGQIVQGAPFDLYFSADLERPQKLEAQQLIEPGSRFTYATGILAFWRPGATLSSLEGALREPTLKILAIANPQLAPYGEAAQEVLERQRLWPARNFRVVMGESLGQTFQFVVSGNAQAGFIALSQIYESARESKKSPEGVLIIDAKLHMPIEQQVVMLTNARNKKIAREFLDFVRSEAGRRVIVASGYR